MAAVFGFFSGTLDEAHELRAPAPVRTVCTEVDAGYFRVRLLNPGCETLYGRVSADIYGANGAVERLAFPHYQELWDKRGVPKIPKKFIGGHVKEAEIDLCNCIPEYQNCNDDEEAEFLEITPSISSVGFMVDVHLIIDDLQPGTRIRGVVALGDDDGRSAKRRRRDREVDAPPPKDGADLADVPVAGDPAAGGDERRSE